MTNIVLSPMHARKQPLQGTATDRQEKDVMEKERLIRLPFPYHGKMHKKPHHPVLHATPNLNSKPQTNSKNDHQRDDQSKTKKRLGRTTGLAEYQKLMQQQHFVQK